MRIIAGDYKGRRLKQPDGLAIRPTSDRLRETVFNILNPMIADARFADLCAGTGAIGIEALSRGAAEVTFVEQSARAVAMIRDNLAHCGISEDVQLIRRPVIAALGQLAAAGRQFDLIYFDPPYDSPLYQQVLTLVGDSELLVEGGVMMVEHRRSLLLQPDYDRLRPYREISQGETRLTFYRSGHVVPSQSAECEDLDRP